MSKSELLVRSILGPIRSDIRPLVYAIEIASDLLFVQKVSWDDIRVTKDIYPSVAKQLKRTSNSTARQIERLANLCWEVLLDDNLVLQYIGKSIKDIRAPSDMIFYFASISINDSQDKEKCLYAVFRDFLFAIDSNISSDTISTAWNDIQATRYEIDYSGNSAVETYDVNGIQLQYLESDLYGHETSVDILYETD